MVTHFILLVLLYFEELAVTKTCDFNRFKPRGSLISVTVSNKRRSRETLWNKG